MKNKWMSKKGGTIKQTIMTMFGYTWKKYGIIGCCRLWSNCNHEAWVR